MTKGWNSCAFKLPAGRRALAFALLFLALFEGGMLRPAQAQQVVSLVSFTNVWRYNSFGLDLGTSWRTNDFDDSAWPSGPGLLQAGETTPYPAPFQTTLPDLNGRVTDYFRTWFTAAPFPPGTILIATNLVDDGCVLYLNGREVSRLRMGTGGVAYNTLASSGATEGLLEPTILVNPEVRSGANLLAVEVHQAATTSADVVFGAHLVAVIPQPLTITNQPADQTVLVGDPLVLSVGVSGGPVHYQWFKDGVAVNNRTNATFPVTSVSLSVSGDYSVVVSNAVSFLTSRVARVVVYEDRMGPSVLSAVVVETGATNMVDLTWNESLLASSVAATNFTVTHLETGVSVAVTNVLTSSRVLRLRLDSTDWRRFEPYVVTFSGVRDTRGNTVAPGTRVPVSWPRWTNALPAGATWTFHNSGWARPSVYSEPWTARDYAEDGTWGAASGVFHRMPQGFTPCSFFGALGLDVGYQAEPYLYRLRFDWPAALGTNVTLFLRHVVDDGAVFYLNGREIYRFNQAAGPITAASRALTSVVTPTCVTNVSVEINFLEPGTNVLAVAVTQAAVLDADTAFGCVGDLRYLETPTLPPPASARLEMSPVAGGGFQLSWGPGGYVLESSTNLSSVLSYPFGPWLEVPGMANPYVLPAAPPTDSGLFYRLKWR